MSNPNDREYTNGEITVFWKPSKCIHATTCFRELLDVFNPRKRPWVNMNGASTEKIIEVTNKCPTQAIAWKYNSDLDHDPLRTRGASVEEKTPETVYEEKEKGSHAVKISIMRNGPILVEGDFTVIGADGNELRTMFMTSFCRCGQSQKQPYCDGTHRKTGFQDTGNGK
jgi:CDGSH-type Zn-finger protein/uncharacterized Fe-S cluster protein YjdI